MFTNEDPLWSGRSSLAAQYGTDANLSARQSIYEYQRPAVDLAGEVRSLLESPEVLTIADIGCGNGKYLAELAQRRQEHRVVGVDLSAGMLAATRERVPRAAVARADATALPFGDATCDVSLAMHMLYHVADPVAVLRELRRITRPGGRVLITLNGQAHLREMLDLVGAVLAARGEAVPLRESLQLDRGQALAQGVFGSVTRLDFGGELFLPETRPVEDYVRSLVIAQHVNDYESVVEEVARRIPFDAEGVFRVRTDAGLLVCG